MIVTWLQDSLTRIYPTRNAVGAATLAMPALRGERISFQVAATNLAPLGQGPVTLDCGLSSDSLDLRVRRVGFVPMPHLNTEVPADELEGADHLPGYVPDPLFPDTPQAIPATHTGAWWVSVLVPADAAPGAHSITVSVRQGEATIAEHTVTVQAHTTVLQPRQGFPVTHWFYCDALFDQYGFSAWEEAFWPLLERYFRNLVEHGQDTISVPAFTPALDGVKRPTQLVRVTPRGDGTYEFDFSLVRRYLQLARDCGLSRFEWSHFFTQWGVRHAIRIYEGHGHDETLLWPPETGATSAIYRSFLAQYLPQFKALIDDEKILDLSYFHVSDEPHGDEPRTNYIAARTMLLELAPWIITMDALSEVEYGRDHLTDIPVPVISSVAAYQAEGMDTWCYYCCVPRGRYLNRLLDTPLAKIRMSGWLFYRLRSQGFLHWGYNYWYRRQTRELIDPYTVSDAHAWPGWAHGDTFLVYPGPDGPIDSIRWEVFAESLQDYAVLQTLGIATDDPRLAALESYEHFPKTAVWHAHTRARLFESL